MLVVGPSRAWEGMIGAVAVDGGGAVVVGMLDGRAAEAPGWDETSSVEMF